MESKKFSLTLCGNQTLLATDARLFQKARVFCPCVVIYCLTLTQLSGIIISSNCHCRYQTTQDELKAQQCRCPELQTCFKPV